MEAWMLIGAYVLLLVVLQVLIYQYLRADGETTFSGPTLLEGTPGEDADIYNGTTPPREYARAAEAGGEARDADGVRRCPHCGSVNGRAYTYCRDCVGLIVR